MEDYLQAVRDHYLDLASDQSIKTDLRAVKGEEAYLLQYETR